MARRSEYHTAPVPSGRLSRLLRMGSMAGGIASGVAAGGVKSLAAGQKPKLESLVFTPRNMTRLSTGLSQMRGAALKLGQMLSMDTGVVLPPELNALLAGMRDGAVAMPPKQLRNVLDRNWGQGWYKRFAHFDVRPFAAASIGQVHRARTHDGRELAIKVQYPGVRQSIDSDVDNLASLLRVSGVVPKELSLDEVLTEAKAQLHAEADYRAEATNLAMFQRLLSNSDRFVTPELELDLCTPQVLAMSYVQSAPLETVQNEPQETRDMIAASLIELVLQELFTFGTMQTDPNFANFRYVPETGQIVLLDFGAVKSFSLELQQKFRTLAQAALGGRHDEMRAAMLRIGYFAETTPEKYQAILLEMFDMAMTPIRQDAPYDFAASDLMDRLRDRGLEIGSERELTHVPPADTLFLHRKIGGTYLMATMLGARVPLRPLVEKYCCE
ncbi:MULTISPECIES: AarF/ABC1/UbiB kinase family protein [Donghicola]|nr:MULTISPECIES: AarF/ABC1/UbiB kinase family protein [Donghicola]MCT4578759.1 AarF/ABC1/UbiB kinase family protein [Donghicola sp.]